MTATNTKVTATELAKHLSDILNRVRYRGERFVIERNGAPVAKLEPLDEPRRVTVAELVEKLGDLELPGDGFADALEEIKRQQPPAEVIEWPC